MATAEAPVITTDRADFSTNINQTTIENLPINGRRWSFFALGTPAPRPTADLVSSAPRISGLLNNNTVDGADNNQPFSAKNAPHAYQLLHQRGQYPGISRSIHPTILRIWACRGWRRQCRHKKRNESVPRTSLLVRRSTGLGRQSILPKTPCQRCPIPFLPVDKRHQFAAELAVQSFKDKLFFFFSADQQLRPFPPWPTRAVQAPYLLRLAPRPLTLTTRHVLPGNTAAVNAALALQTGSDRYSLAAGRSAHSPSKIDWNVNSRNRASFTYNRLRWNSPQGIQTAAVVHRGIESFGNDYERADWGIARLTTTISANMTNEIRYQYGRDFEFQNGQSSISGEPVSQLGVSPQITIKRCRQLGFRHAELSKSA